MNQSITQYIEIVGKDKILQNLKEDLKEASKKAITLENWYLTREITELLERIFDDRQYDLQLNSPEANKILIRCVEIIGIERLNSNLQTNLSQAINLEDWILVKEIAEIMQKNPNDDRANSKFVVNADFKLIIKELIEQEDWQILNQISNLFKNYFELKEYLPEDTEREYLSIKSNLKLIVRELIDRESWEISADFCSAIGNNFGSSQQYSQDLNLMYPNLKPSLKIITAELIDRDYWDLAYKIIKIIKNSLSSSRKYYQDSLYRQNLKSKLINTIKIAIAKKDYNLIIIISTLIAKNYKDDYDYNLEKLIELIVENLEVEKERVTLESSFANDLGCDDLDWVELIMAVEEEFDLEIDDEIQEQIDTVKKLYDVVIANIDNNEF